jgi:hypothetical protein
MSEHLTYRIDRNMRLVHLRIEQVQPIDVIAQLVDRIIADPAFRKNMNWLVDRSEVPEIPPPEYARGIAEMLSSRIGQLGSFRMALLLRPGLHFETPPEHLAHLASVGIEAQVFTSWTQAIAWVGARG